MRVYEAGFNTDKYGSYFSCPFSFNLLYKMDLIHYSFAPLILFRVPYTLDFLPYYLSIENGAGGVGIFEILIFQCLYRSYRVNNKVIDALYILMYYYSYWNFVCSVTRRVGFVHKFICGKPAVTRTNNQGLTNLYESVVFHNYSTSIGVVFGSLKTTGR